MNHKRILVVDDNVDAGEAVAMLLESEGHDVHTATSGQAALREVNAWSPDAVVIDIGLPDMDGHELARAIGGLSLSPRPVLVTLSGYGGPEVVSRSRAAGVQCHLVKPAEPAQLFAALEEAVPG